MHGNTPNAGLPEDESNAGMPADGSSSECRRALRRDLVDVATSTRELLSDDFVVGAEIVDEDNGLHATVAVQPPAGAVVSAGFETASGSEADVESLARDLAAGAVLEAKHAIYPSHQSAR